MQARFVWTPTLWDLTNSSGGLVGNGPREGPLLPLIYLDESPCAYRKASDPSYRCLVLRQCTIGKFDVRESLSIGFDGIFSVKHIVKENEPMGGISIKSATASAVTGMLPMAAAPPHVDNTLPLTFKCMFSELDGMGSEKNVTLQANSQVRVISNRPTSSTAQVIKPTSIRTAIVSTLITVEAVLDQSGLRIVQGNCAINGEDIVAAFDLGRGLYTVEYEVKEGDTDRPLGKLPFNCEFEDQAGNNATVGPMNLQSWFSVNANPPHFKEVRIVRPLFGKARAGDQVVVEMLTGRVGLVYEIEKCLLNDIDVTTTKNVTEGGSRIELTLNVTTGQSDWFAGQLSIDCWIKDKDGNAAHVVKFTDVSCGLI